MKTKKLNSHIKFNPS